MDEPLADYVEDVALFFEGSGLPRIAGRILGLMLVCDPPHRSGAQLAEELGASRASISTMTRMLEGAGLLERAGIPGDRARYHRVAVDGFEARFATLMKMLVGFRPLADRGLVLLGDADPSQTLRLRELRGLYAFLEREMPAMLERWREERDSWVGETS